MYFKPFVKGVSSILTTDERIGKLYRRAGVSRRRRETRSLTGLSTACAALCGVLLYLTGALSGARRAAVPELYGSILLFENAGGYVLVGVVSFALAVAITLLCLRHRERNERYDDNEEEKPT